MEEEASVTLSRQSLASTYEGAVAALRDPSSVSDEELIKHCFYFCSRAMWKQKAIEPQLTACDVEDLTQSLTINLWSGLRAGRVRIKTSVFGYVEVAATRLVWRFLKKRPDWVSYLDAELYQPLSLEDPRSAASESIFALLDLLEDLPLNEARIILLCDYHGFTVRAASAALGIKETTAHHRRKLGLHKLRHLLQDGENGG